MKNKTELISTQIEAERAVTAALLTQGEYAIDPLEELAELCRTAGASVVGTVTQKAAPTPATLFGKGKVSEIKQVLETAQANLLVVDNELTGSQARNLSDALGVKVVDRSGLILDIFALRAATPEGKLQVELAQLKYNLPRLIGAETNLARLGGGSGGIGMRGPGEKKLEIDRRVIRSQIADLTSRLEKLKAERDLRRARRTANAEKTVSLVGYTNAGKSTILNALSRSDVLSEDKLFATLDPVTRRVYADEKHHFLMTDTVGFIRNLPHEFVSAFASTLEEARLADLLLIVLDVSAPDLMFQYDVVTDVLQKLQIVDRETLVVFNKNDQRVGGEALPPVGDRIFVSAKTGYNMAELKQVIVNKLFKI